VSPSDKNGALDQLEGKDGNSSTTQASPPEISSRGVQKNKKAKKNIARQGEFKLWLTSSTISTDADFLGYLSTLVD